MEKEFGIEAKITTTEELSDDMFWDKVIEFIELNKWYFGGGINEIKDGMEFEINGVISVEDDLTCDAFYTKLILFFESVGWAYTCEVVEFIDGYYINQDGTRGSHVMGDDYVKTENKNKTLNKIRKLIALGGLVVLIASVILGPFVVNEENDTQN